MNLGRIVALSKDPEVQQLAQKYGREVFGADDLADALEIVQKVNPDLILFDQWLGTEKIHEFILRSSAITNNKSLKRTDKYLIGIPVVVVGCGDDDTDLSVFIQDGAFDYLNARQDYDRFERIVKKIKNKSNLRMKLLETEYLPDFNGKVITLYTHNPLRAVQE